MTQPSPAFNAALQVTQQAVTILAKWADPQLANKFPHVTESDTVTKAKQTLSWSHNSNLKPLQLLFDSVTLSQSQNQVHYWQARAIENQDNYPSIPYPQSTEPTEFSELKKQIQTALNDLDEADWRNLSLLNLIIEKFGSFLSFGESDIALVDIARSTAALAAAIANNPNASDLNLVAGDLSGIQKFIFTISSDGSLKSLRARSFYLELVTEEIVQQILSALKLPRTNVIYAGGGNLYILAEGTEDTKNTIQQVGQQINKWLLGKFQGKVFLALDCKTFPIKEIDTPKFAEYWSEATKQLAKHKARKFADQITEFIKPNKSYEPCRVCHRDDVKTLEPLSKEPDAALACNTCCNMFDLGGQLFRVKAIVRSSQKDINSLHRLVFELPATDKLPAVNIYYHLFQNEKPIVAESDTVLLVNDWKLEHYQFRHFPRNTAPLLLGNYGKKTDKLEEDTFMAAGEFVEKAEGIPRVGYLRMDVDSLGQIFARGLGDKQTLPRIAGLSRQMSYLFKVYLNSLAEKRLENLPKSDKVKTLTKKARPNLLFIYAGGDDLFVSGAWNEVVEFAFDVYQCFRAYTGYNPDITLSGGISIDDTKFPLYQAADKSGEAEEAAKGNGRDSLGLFDEVFKWDEWLGIKDINFVDSDTRKYLNPESQPELLGVMPFVERLEKQDIGLNYSRSFVRNLLITAEIQEEALKKFEDKKSKEAMGTRYYLHLPKIAYTLARLPRNILKDEEFRTSLKSPYNAPYFRAIATWIELLNR